MKSLILSLFILLAFKTMSAQKTIFFTGTNNSEEINSIVVCEIDEVNSDMQIIKKIPGGVRPGYIAISNDRDFLYAVSGEKFEGNSKHNILNAFKIEKNTWDLTYLNSQSSFGSNPCHISLNPTNDLLFTANYSSGGISAYHINNDGKIGEATSIIQHEGSGPDLSRQEGPHAHYINTSIDGNYVYATDLGTDKVMIYSLNKDGYLIPNKAQEYLQLSPGSGPRHMAFHKNKQFVFVLNELNYEVVSCLYDSSNGKLTIIDQHKTIDDNFKGENTSAAIHIHPNGKYLYCSNRGENSISVFKIKEDGKLSKVQVFTEGLGIVRDFNLDPSGKFLVAGNQRTGEIILLKVAKNGLLSSTGKVLNVVKPTCVVFF